MTGVARRTQVGSAPLRGKARVSWRNIDLAYFFPRGSPIKQSNRTRGPTMDIQDKLKDLAAARKAAHTRLIGLKSNTYAAFLELEKAAYADGALTKKMKELIAVGISVVINCESCMQWHIEEAAKAGATREEALEAIEVGIEMGGGPATVSARFALGVMDSVWPHGEAS